MALLDRLLGLQPDTEEKLPVHQFMAGLAEYKRGAVTKVQIVSAFNLTTAEATALQDFLDNLDTSTIDRTLIHDVLMLGEVGHYTKAQVQSRLGI